jgi:large subunit ribosomal protein L25
MEMLALSVKTREVNGKGAARKLRAEGLIPVTIYGEGQEPVSAEVDAKAFEVVTNGKLGENALLDVTVEDQAQLNGPAMIRAVQHHPVNSRVLSADFQRINIDKPVVTVVPIRLVGQCKGLLEGGIPDQTLHKVQIKALPKDVPDVMEADLTPVGIGYSFHVRDLTPVEGVTVLTAPERSIINIKAPRVSKRPQQADAKGKKAAK